jgi:hypothetical protein
MSTFVPPSPKELLSAYIVEIDQHINEMDDSIVQINHALAATQARLHALLCAKSVLEDKLVDWDNLPETSDTPSLQEEQLEFPFPQTDELPDNIVPFTHGVN